MVETTSSSGKRTPAGAAAIGRLMTLVVCAAAAACAARTEGQVPAEAPAPPSVSVRFDVVERTIPELQAAMQAGIVTSRALTALYLARIDAYDRQGPALTAMIALNPQALQQAAALDEERRTRGPRGPLHGIPLVVKDNFETADMPTTAASRALDGFQTGRDAFQIARLRAAGAVVIGKTNLHELAYGITTVSSLGGQTRNPYDPARNPGGSSGGTGAAVAASFAAAGMGSDTCGSIRIPSAHNNLFGLRGSMGLSSRSGIVPLALTQDIGGPLARSTVDLALLLDATAGFDPDDPVTGRSNGRIPRSFLNGMGDTSLRGIRIGVLGALFGSAPEDGEVASIVRASLGRLHDIGAEIIEAELPDLQKLLSGTSTINAEFKHDLAEYLARHPTAPVRTLADILGSGRFHTAVEALIRRANEVETRDSEAYRDALGRRAALRAAVLAFMDDARLDALAYPTLRRKPAHLGEPQVGSNCQLSPATELPALSVPAGFTIDGLPVGLELLGGPFTEARLLGIAYAYEQAYRPRRPPPSTPPLPYR
jgi:amidase